MKMVSLLIVCLLLAGSGCNGLSRSRGDFLPKEERFRQIHIGMSKAQAVAVLGRPDASGTLHAMWSTKDPTTGKMLRLVLFLDANGVIRQTSVTQPGPSYPSKAVAGNADYEWSPRRPFLADRDPRFEGFYQAYPMDSYQPPRVPFPELLSQSR